MAVIPGAEAGRGRRTRESDRDLVGAGKIDGRRGLFLWMQREGAEWHVKAVCTGNGTAWNANINLAVSGDRLRWSSERGTTVYVRCSRG